VLLQAWTVGTSEGWLPCFWTYFCGLVVTFDGYFAFGGRDTSPRQGFFGLRLRDYRASPLRGEVGLGLGLFWSWDQALVSVRSSGRLESGSGHSAIE
jgi:hypothetical protein